MKKFLTVLLVIAVMFTFSFNTAFAAMDKTMAVETEKQAYDKVDEWYNDAVKLLNSAEAESLKKNDAAAVAEAKAEVQSAIDKQYAKAIQYLRDQIAAFPKEQVILGYTWDKPANTEAGYVNFRASKAYLVDMNWESEYWDAEKKALVVTALTEKAAYNKALADAKKAIEAFDVEVFAKDDKLTVGTVTKSSYEWAVAKKTDALAELATFGEYKAGTYDKEAVKKIYNVQHEGTLGVTRTGTFFNGKAGLLPSMAQLKTAATVTTDAAKVEYAKTQALAGVKKAIETQRATELKDQNDKIFAQSVASKPNQAIIEKAKEEIEKINARCDAMLKIWEFRFANAEFKVEKAANVNDTNEYVYAYYDDVRYNGLNTTGVAIGYFKNNIYAPHNSGIYDTLAYTDLLTVLPVTSVEAITEKVAALEKEAKALKADIAVDGSIALEIDAALEAAVKDVYMTGEGKLAYAMSDTVVHMHAHQLLGYDCKDDIVGKVTVDGKAYDRLDKWATDVYSYKNTSAVKAIIREAEAAIKAAATVADADKAFLDAYAKYDAVPTIQEQKALFSYSGALYAKDAAAEAELEAYIDYKVKLLGDKKPAENTATAMTAYFNIEKVVSMTDDAFKNSYLGEVVDEATLQAAIAKVKEAANTLKTKAELEAEGKALIKEVNEVKRPVKIEQKEAVLALYDKVVDYIDYASMVGFNKDFMTRSEVLAAEDVEDIADLERVALDAMKKALGKVSALTLDDEAEVDAFVDAQDAYNDLFGKFGDYKSAFKGQDKATSYTAADEYAAKIWELKVEAVQAMIAALPMNASAAKVAAAKSALKDLGFAGICAIRNNEKEELLTKLNKFDYDASYAVKSMKLRAYSKYAKKGITVKWVIEDGRKSDAKGYQVWRSTKANSGYKKLITVNPSYGVVNAKNLKKGVTYYYKVRAYNRTEDGKLIFSDWSNKAYRKAK